MDQYPERKRLCKREEIPNKNERLISRQQRCCGLGILVAGSRVVQAAC